MKVDSAARCLNFFWPLTSFIACNPLKGYEDLPFEEALRLSGRLFGARGFMPLSEYRAMYESGRISPADLQEAFADGRELSSAAQGAVSEAALSTLADCLDERHGTGLLSLVNKQMIKWCSAYLDKTQAQWNLDGTDGFFASWRKLAAFDHSLTLYGVKNWKQELSQLPDDSALALQLLLDKIGVAEGQVVDYLTRHLAQLVGFASHLKWRQAQGDSKLLTDYLAMRLFYEWQYARPLLTRFYDPTIKPWTQLSPAAGGESAVASREGDYASLWQDAYESNYRNRLLTELTESCRQVDDNKVSPQCQLVFCIDVRSEPVRRNLEKLGPYATFGFAGFFGFAMQFKPLGSALSLDLCPVLIKPSKSVTETDRDGKCNGKVNLQSLLASAIQLRKRLKSSLLGAFGLVEGFGLASALPLFARTIAPRQYENAVQAVGKQLCGHGHTEIDASAFSLEEKIALARGNLKAIGIAKEVAPIVVLCGHKGHSQNNPYASALDCGACGGNAGGASARLAALILNDKAVRLGLASQGVFVPDESVFVAAEHNTTTDNFEFYDVPELTTVQQQIFERLQADLEKAATLVREERRQCLPKSVIAGMNEPSCRSVDWAQVAPEWGLAGNAAFIAAPRSVTAGVNLKGRSFLHSYDCRQDEDGSVLELIMTAPMVVAQWINMQYYLSTMDNEVFGSGSKVVHNVVGDFGVMQGALSDLKIGLPAQSVMSAEGERMHEPMRLLVVIRATTEAIDNVLKKHEHVASLVKNRWLHLVAMNPDNGEFSKTDERLLWRPVRTGASVSVATLPEPLGLLQQQQLSH
ncbi:MAG TPA: DUF2309 domain-containing protein [Candidatus Obscuribacter sp.]|nr:DUF2309 domain-containing protein [Candidatus Obscuribacter sp.]